MSVASNNQNGQVISTGELGQKNEALILVLLPTYNGEAYLTEQIESILSQTYQHWLLVCRDDDSSDESDAILLKYTQRFPAQVIRIQDHQGNLGASASFSTLMEWALLNYADTTGDNDVLVALADQDDIWHPERLDSCLQRMKCEQAGSADLPLLVHSNLRVVHSNGKESASSFMTYQGLDPRRVSLGAQLVSNTVTGCTCLMNMALLRQALPVPKEAVMHDWWLSLVAAAFGRLCYIDRSLVDYRQHGRNTIGAKAFVASGLNKSSLRKIFTFRIPAETQALFTDVAAQADIFYKRFQKQLNNRQKWIVSQVCRLPNSGVWRLRIVSRILRRL